MKAIILELSLDGMGDTVEDILCGFSLGTIAAILWPAIAITYFCTYTLMLARKIVRKEREEPPFEPMWRIMFWPNWKEWAPSTVKKRNKERMQKMNLAARPPKI